MWHWDWSYSMTELRSFKFTIWWRKDERHCAKVKSRSFEVTARSFECRSRSSIVWLKHCDERHHRNNELMSVEVTELGTEKRSNVSRSFEGRRRGVDAITGQHDWPAVDRRWTVVLTSMTSPRDAADGEVGNEVVAAAATTCDPVTLHRGHVVSLTAPTVVLCGTWPSMRQQCPSTVLRFRPALSQKHTHLDVDTLYVFNVFCSSFLFSFWSVPVSAIL